MSDDEIVVITPQQPPLPPRDLLPARPFKEMT